MKICILADTHWGVRADSIVFHDYFKQTLNEFLFPTLRKHNVKKIIHLGDLVDRRKYVNFLTASRLREDFLDVVNKEFQMDLIIGNHDTFYKNTNETNSANELLEGKYENISIFKDPVVASDTGMDILYVPWICDDNKQITLEFLDSAKAQIVMGHLELSGFEMYKGHINTHGMTRSVFEKFDVVMSGHYHHKSNIGSVHYMGALCEHTWSDYNDPRGFHIFDTETRELEFFKNPFVMHQKIFYNDASKTIEQLFTEVPNVAGKIVKLVIQEKTNPYFYDLFVAKLEEQQPYEIKSVEDHLNIVLEDDEEILNEAEDTFSLFRGYVGQLELEERKRNDVEKTILNLYNEASQII